MRELLEGTEEINFSLIMSHWFALQANQWVLYTKRKREKNEIPGIPSSFWRDQKQIHRDKIKVFPLFRMHNKEGKPPFPTINVHGFMIKVASPFRMQSKDEKPLWVCNKYGKPSKDPRLFLLRSECTEQRFKAARFHSKLRLSLGNSHCISKTAISSEKNRKRKLFRFFE